MLDESDEVRHLNAVVIALRDQLAKLRSERLKLNSIMSDRTVVGDRLALNAIDRVLRGTEQ